MLLTVQRFTIGVAVKAEYSLTEIRDRINLPPLLSASAIQPFLLPVHRDGAYVLLQETFVAIVTQYAPGSVLLLASQQQFPVQQLVALVRPAIHIQFLL